MNLELNRIFSLDYLAGIFDGEGSFIISLSRRRNSPVGFLVAPMVSLSMFNGDSILLRLREQFGGHINPTSLRSNGFSKLPLPEWNLCGRASRSFAKRIVSRLTIKRKDCETFLKIHKLMADGFHYTKDGFLQIVKLRETLNKTRSRFWTLEKIKPILQDITYDATYNLWTKKEDIFLIEKWRELSDEELSQFLPRHTIQSIRRRRMRLNLKRPKGGSRYALAAKRTVLTKKRDIYGHFTKSNDLTDVLKVLGGSLALDNEQQLALLIKTTWKYLFTVPGMLSNEPYSVWQSPNNKLRVQIHDVDNEIVSVQKIETDEWFLNLRDIIRLIKIEKG